MILHALLIGALVGVVVGVVVGSLGAGGGIVSVPILVYVLGQDPHQATGLVPHHRGADGRRVTGDARSQRERRVA